MCSNLKTEKNKAWDKEWSFFSPMALINEWMNVLMDAWMNGNEYFKSLLTPIFKTCSKLELFWYKIQKLIKLIG